MISYTTSYVTFVLGAIRASKQVHNMLARSILGSTLRWLDSTPVGRVVSRFTQGMWQSNFLFETSTNQIPADMRNIDGPIPNTFLDLVGMSYFETLHSDF